MMLEYDVNDVMSVAQQFSDFTEDTLGFSLSQERITDFVHTIFQDNGFTYVDEDND